MRLPVALPAEGFSAWRDNGLWSQILAVLVREAREAEGRQATSTAVVVDSPSVKTTRVGGPRSLDAGKKVKGRKRPLAVDTLGLPIERKITGASTQDRDARAPLLQAVKRTDKEVKGFVLSPKRWVVERTLRWINRARRLSKDDQATIESARA